MNKKLMTAALAAALTWTVTQTAHAVSNPLNNQDSIQITITPNVDRGVEIDSTTVAVDLGTLNLYTTTQTVRPATVTVLGTLANQELTVAGSIAPAWSFDTTPSIDSTSGEEDALAFYLLFSDTSLSAAPTGAEFSADNGAFTGATLRAGGDVGDGTTFEKTAGGAKDMDTLQPAEQAHLWFYLRLPNTTTSSAAQTVTVTLTAVDAS